ncbi:hypothetical protein ACLMJK_007142 [Lecanora helva]
MPSNLHPTAEMRNIHYLQRYVKNFAESVQQFQVLSTLPQSDARLTRVPEKLYVLDSSFNPPTRAHLRICTSALLNDQPTVTPKRLLLLLATQNADKAPKPASFAQRLAMMEIFAHELLHTVSPGLDKGEVVVDVGVTKNARFIDKLEALENWWNYTIKDLDGKRRPVEQVHLTGFDTLIRLLDIKYYPPEHSLKPLDGLFAKHRLRVTKRTDDVWGGREAQEEYLNTLSEGEREYEGGKREWADRIELVDGRKEGEEIISSTKVREATKAKDQRALDKLVTNGVAKWIMDEKLYLE